MANPMPCQMCTADGEHKMSDWLITCQQPVIGFEPGNTFYVCMDHLAVLAVSYLQSVADTSELVEVAELEGPGVLEQIEQEDGKVTPVGGNGGGRKRHPSAQKQDTDESQLEASSADVDG